MPPEPNTPQPLIPFKMPHLTPVLDAPSPLVPESAAFLSLSQYLTEKANLEFTPVKFRTPEHRARLVIVKAQCEELEKQVMLERMVAQIAQLRQEIKELKARLRKHGSKQGRVGPRTRLQHKADRAAIAAKQAELSKLEAAQAQLSGIPTVNELHELTRNQFLKMVGMTVLATVIWNEAAAFDAPAWAESGWQAKSMQGGSSGYWSLTHSASASWYSSSAVKFLDELAAAAKKRPFRPYLNATYGVTNWAWACVAAAVGNYTAGYLGLPCDLVNKMIPTLTIGCCPTSSPAVAPAPCDLGYDYMAFALWATGAPTNPPRPASITGSGPWSPTLYTGILSWGAQPNWAALTSQFTKVPDLLFVIVVKDASGFTHAIIVRLVNSTTDEFVIEDPSFGTSTHKSASTTAWPGLITMLETRYKLSPTSMKWHAAWLC